MGAEFGSDGVADVCIAEGSGLDAERGVQSGVSGGGGLVVLGSEGFATGEGVGFATGGGGEFATGGGWGFDTGGGWGFVAGGCGGFIAGGGWRFDAGIGWGLFIGGVGGFVAGGAGGGRGFGDEFICRQTDEDDRGSGGRVFWPLEYRRGEADVATGSSVSVHCVIARSAYIYNMWNLR